MNQLLKSPLAHLLRHHARALSVAVTIAIFLGVYTYTCSVYFSSVLTHYAGFSRHTSSWIITIGQMSVMIWTPIWAYWADQYGGKRILSIGFLLGAITPSVLWMLALSKTFSLAVLSQCLYGMTIASVFGPAFFFITRLFPVTVRGTGFPLAWNTGMALFGGTAPLIATALAQHVHFMAPPVYVSMIAVLSAIIVWKNAPASSALEVESTSA